MNRIYRRLWNRARQCWVVASELASSQGKVMRGGRCSALIVSLLLTPTLAQAATSPSEESVEAMKEERALQWAFGLPMTPQSAITAGPTPVRQVSLTTDYSYRDSTVSGDHLVVLGSRSSLVGSTSVGYGNLIESRGDHNVAVGFGVKVRQGYSTAVGGSALADGVGATAFGNNAKAYTNNSIAVGSGSSTDSGAGISKIAIGGDARAGTGGWTGAMAIGGNSSATHDSVALGYQAVTTTTGAVALGRGSLANEANTVSVGNASTRRRIVNLADARLNTTSTDAVTGKQLNATNQNVSTATSTANTARTTANTAKTTADSALARANQATDLISQTAANGQVRLGANNTGTVIDVSNKSGAKRRIQNIDNGVLSTSSTDAVTGRQLHATNLGVTKAQSTADAISTRLSATTLAVGSGASAAGQYATATGHNSNASGERAFAGGVNSVASGAHSSAMGSGAKATHTNSVALGAGSVTYSNNSVSVGNTTTKRKIQYVADGGVSAGSTDAVTGSQLFATNQNVAAAQSTATAAQTSAAAAKSSADTALAKANQLGGLVGQAAVNGSVRLGAENTGTALDVRNKANANRTISGVADAGLTTTSTEAVTGRQLHATNTQVTTAQNTATAAQIAATGARTVADNALAKTTALDGLVRQTAANGSVRLGAENTGNVLDVLNKANANRTISGVADAALSAASTEVVTGRQLHATNTLVTTAQNTAVGAKTTADDALGRATALSGLVGQVSTNGNLRLGADNTGTIVDVANKSGGKRRIYNIANGVLGAGSTDAVTGQQLYTTNTNVETQRQTLAAHSLALSDQSGLIAGNRSDLDALRSEFDDFDPDLEGVVRFEADGAIDLNGGKVRGVAAGDISSAASTEAVNGGQLFATNERIASMEQGGRFFKIGTDSESEDAHAGWFGIAIGESAEASRTGEGGTAVGAFTKALGINSVALGRGAFVHESATQGFALGSSSRVDVAGGVALGSQARVTASALNGVALGYGSFADEANTLSIGSEHVKRRIVNVGRGTAEHDAIIVSQLNESLGALGGGAHLDASGDVVAPTYSVQGGTQSTVGDALVALDSAVVTGSNRITQVESQLRSVFQDSSTLRSDGLNQLTFAGANGMVLSNVANGAIAAGSRDAVNGGQLHSLQQQLNGRVDGLEQRIDGQPQSRSLSVASVEAPSATPAHSPVADESVTPPAADTPEADTGAAPPVAPQANSPKVESPTPQVDTAELEKMLARANEYTDGAISNFERRLDKMDKRFNRMAAMSSAQTAMAMNTAGLATYNRLGAGVGYAEGESAMAVGYQRVLNEKGSATFSLNGAFTNSGERSMGVGVGIGW
ncbi:YadA-like family protein [Stenotrophomonas maltophilia]|nr:YadA-like family protein [Stenotrophomonas maltophilia]